MNVVCLRCTIKRNRANLLLKMNVPGLTQRCQPLVMMVKRLCCCLSSQRLPVSHAISAPQASSLFIRGPQKQAACLLLQPCERFSQMSPSVDLTSKDCSMLCRDATHCSDPVEFLDKLDADNLQTCIPNDVAGYIVQLGHCQMQYLSKCLPWLEPSYHVGYKQLLMADRMEEVSQCVREHAHFVYLCKCLEQSYKDCDNESLAYSALMLLYIGMPPENPILQKLLIELRIRLPEMDVRQTSLVARVYLAMPMLDTITGRKIVNRFTEFFNTDYLPSAEEFNCLCIIVLKMIRLLTADRLLAFFRLAQELTKQPGYLDNSIHIENFSLALLKVSDHMTIGRREIDLVSAQLKEATLRNLHNLSYRGLRCVCNTLQHLRWQYSDDFRMKCEDHALSLLHDDCSIREIVSLLSVCNQRTDRDTLAMFEEKLYDKLEDIDGHLLGNLARCLNEVNPHRISQRTWYKFQHVAADQGRFFIEYSGRLTHALASLLFRRPEGDLCVHHKLTSSFMQYLQRMDHDMRYVSSVLLYLMLVPGCPGLPEPLFDKMLSSIPRWDMRHVSVTMLRLNTVGGKLSPKCQRQIELLQVVFQMRFLELLPNVATLGELCSLTRRMIHAGQNPALLDDAVFKAVIDRYTILSTRDMDEATANAVVSVFSKFKYYLPSLFDDIVSSVNNMKVTLKLKTYTKLLQLLGKVGYKPKEFDEFVEGVLETWQECWSEQNYRMVLFILHYLSHLECYPMKELKLVFSLDFLQAIDRELKERHHEIRNCLMMLNQACVLECPELGIPWFHEQFCKKNVRVPKNKMFNLVKPALEKVLGGEQYLSSAVLSPYYHTLDFECVLDENHQPIHRVITSHGVKETWQRVAILLQTQHKYCLHSKHLDGINQVKIRHLKLLGYRVVEIPFYEWNTAERQNDFDNQCSYLYNKLFS